MNTIGNTIRTTVAAVVATAALGLVAGCGDVEPPANDIGKTVEKKKGPAPKIPAWDHPNRMDFGDGKATLPAEPEPPKDRNRSRLDFGEAWRG